MKSEIADIAYAPPEYEFAMQFASTPRAARLARRLAVERLAEWGYPPDSDLAHTVALLVSELAGNAVRHGRVPGRDFRLRLTVTLDVLRIEVSDARAEKPPQITDPPSPETESGRGLLLVGTLATRWGMALRDPVGKTVWCEIPLNQVTWADHPQRRS